MSTCAQKKPILWPFAASFVAFSRGASGRFCFPSFLAAATTTAVVCVFLAKATTKFLRFPLLYFFRRAAWQKPEQSCQSMTRLQHTTQERLLHLLAKLGLLLLFKKNEKKTVCFCFDHCSLSYPSCFFSTRPRRARMTTAGRSIPHSSSDTRQAQRSLAALPSP